MRSRDTQLPLQRAALAPIITMLALLLVTACSGVTEGEADTGSAGLPTNTPSGTMTNADTTTSTPLPTATYTPGTVTAASSTSTATAIPSGTTAPTATSGSTNQQASSGPMNQVRVINRADDKFRFKSKVQLNQITGTTANPGNLAFAFSSCSDCETFAVALQINVISRDTTYAAPENVALAFNLQCTTCYTVAQAYQMTFSVDDPTTVPQEANDLIKAFEDELKAIKQTKDITAAEAHARVAAIIAEFRMFATGLKEQMTDTADETTPGAPADPGTETGSELDGEVPLESTPATEPGTPAATATTVAPATMTSEPSATPTP